MKKLLIGILIVLLLSIATVSANPVLNLIGNQVVNENSLLQFSITCSAPDNGATTFATNSSFGTLTKVDNTHATFSWTPGYDDEGIYSARFTASDLNSSDNSTITITVYNTNRAPVWTSSIPSITVIEDSGQALIYTDLSAFAVDPDGDSLTFGIGSEDTSKVDCTIDPDGTDFRVNPAADFSGTSVCSVRANDGSSYKDNNVTITVTNLEDAPVITSSARTSGYVNTAYTYNVLANDPDGDSLSYSLATFPDGMTISGSGAISWTPNATGSYNVVAVVTDGKTPVQQSYTIAVDYPPKLEINDVNVWVDGKDDESANEEGGSIDNKVRPGSEIKMKVKLKNTYTSSEDIDITDIVVKILASGLDEDGDDIELEEEVDDLGPGRSKTIYLTFKVPYKVDAGDYDLTLTASASDDNRDYEMDVDYTVEVTKETHAVVVSESVLTPEKLVCSRHGNFYVEIMNIGRDDEESSDNIKLTVASTSLGIDFSKSRIELDGDPDSDTNVYANTFSIDLEENFAPGTYPIDVRVYRGSTLMSSKEAQLIVEQCVLQAGTTTSTQQTTAQTQQQSGGSQNTQASTNTGGANLPGDLPPEFAAYLAGGAEEETSFSDSGWYIAILVIVILGVLGLGVFLVLKFLIKPKTGMGEFNY